MPWPVCQKSVPLSREQLMPVIGVLIEHARIDFGYVCFRLFVLQYAVTDSYRYPLDVVKTRV